jgi:hypothetical protein
MIVAPLRHTVELWDESRNANNAIEMAMRGHWLTPTYAWVSDHWNTKPPLFIWIVAGLEKLGVAPIAALRLPSSISALAVVMLIYLFCRNVLRRSFTGIAAALILMSSTLYFGLHVSMTGDYDALLCLFMTVYALGLYCYVEPVEGYVTKGLVIGAIALLLAIMTKGVAGVLLLPGLFLYILVRKRLLAVVRDPKFWLALLGVAAMTALYYKGRDLVDPGYIHDVWGNELGGRYAVANEGHHARTLYYANYLVHHFVPGLFLFVLAFFSIRRSAARDERSRGAVLLGVIASITLLLVLTKAATKISYYAAPALPLMSIAGAIGLADVLRRLAGRSEPAEESAQNTRFHKYEVYATVLLLMGVGVTTAIGLKDGAAVSGGEHTLYGAVLDTMEKNGTSGPVVVLDHGFDTNANFHQYDPIADYFAKVATRRGMPTIVVHEIAAVPSGAWVASCDPAFVRMLMDEQRLTNVQSTSGSCIYGKSI